MTYKIKIIGNEEISKMIVWKRQPGFDRDENRYRQAIMVEPENQVKYSAQHQLSYGKRPHEELYEIANDPYQIHNLAEDPAFTQIREDLRKRLEDHLKATGDPRMEGKDPWQAYIYHQADGFGATYNMSLPEHERARHALRPGN